MKFILALSLVLFSMASAIYAQSSSSNPFSDLPDGPGQGTNAPVPTTPTSGSVDNASGPASTPGPDVATSSFASVSVWASVETGAPGTTWASVGSSGIDGWSIDGVPYPSSSASVGSGSSEGGSSNKLAIGLGVGLGGGAFLALVATGFVLYQRRKTRRSFESRTAALRAATSPTDRPMTEAAV